MTTSGVTAGTDSGTNYYGPYSNLYSWGWDGKDELGFLPAPLGVNETWELNATGSYTVSVNWVDDSDNPAPNPPPKLSLLLTGGAGWEAPAQNAAVSDSGAADGLGDALVSFANPESIGGNSTGKHLRQYDSSSGSVFDTVIQSASVTAQSQNDQPYGDQVGVIHGLQAAEDPRSVAISSPDIDVSHHKGPPDSSGNPTSANNVPDGAGVTNADSVLDWDGEGWNGGLSLPNGHTYVATEAGFSNPSFSWSAPGTYSELDIPGQPTSTITDHIYFGSSTSGFPQQSTFTVTVTDTDGAMATNTYNVNWHMPYEKTSDGPSWKKKYLVQERITPGLSPGTSGTLVDSPAGDFPIDAVIDAIPVVGDELKNIVSAILDVTQWSYHYDDEPTVEEGATNDATTWQVAVGDGNVPDDPDGIDLRNDPDGWMQCTMKLDRFRYEEGDAAYADSFDVHGYNSSNHYLDAPAAVWFADEPVFTISH